jgi:hypothetical protein
MVVDHFGFCPTFECNDVSQDSGLRRPPEKNSTRHPRKRIVSVHRPDITVLSFKKSRVKTLIPVQFCPGPDRWPGIKNPARIEQ